MGTLYLREMANWFRSAGLKVVEFEGWQNRSRSTGGYEPGRPKCIMWHHTASSSSASAQADCNYMCYVSDAKPTTNIYIARKTGEVWVLAAGASNTNGTGRSRSFSTGTVPEDSMNTYAVGIEIGNNGVGEPYDEAVINAAFTVSNVLCSKLGLQPTDVDTHQDYAPDRKVDPATTSAVQGAWNPRSCTSAGTWNVDDLKSECKRRATPAPTPEPEPDLEEDDEVIMLIKAKDGTAEQKAPTFWWDGKQIGWVRAATAINLGKWTKAYTVDKDGKPFDSNLSAAEIQRTIMSGWAGGPVPEGYRKPTEANQDSGVS